MRLHLQISNQTGVPAYRQIMEQFTEYRRSGILKEHDRLPSIRELARQLALNPGTVVKAYQELEHEGVIYSQHGKGVFVAKSEMPPLSKAEKTRVVREAARQLCLQARRMDLAEAEVNHLIREEYTKLHTR